jgi:hypothetical protein
MTPHAARRDGRQAGPAHDAGPKPASDQAAGGYERAVRG